LVSLDDDRNHTDYDALERTLERNWRATSDW